MAIQAQLGHASLDGTASHLRRVAPVELAAAMRARTEAYSRGGPLAVPPRLVGASSAGSETASWRFKLTHYRPGSRERGSSVGCGLQRPRRGVRRRRRDHPSPLTHPAPSWSLTHHPNAALGARIDERQDGQTRRPVRTSWRWRTVLCGSSPKWPCPPQSATGWRICNRRSRAESLHQSAKPRKVLASAAKNRRQPQPVIGREHGLTVSARGRSHHDPHRGRRTVTV